MSNSLSIHRFGRVVVAAALVTAVVVSVGSAAQPAQAAPVDCSRGVNLSFEQPVINQNWQIVSAPGWATASAGTEIWQSGFLGAVAPDGAQLSELQSNNNSPSWQDIPTLAGDEIAWSFHHRGRSNPDRVLVNMGSTASQTNQGDFTTGTSAFVQYAGVYTVPAGQTTTRFVFDPVDSGSVGNLVDAVAFALTCDITLVSSFTDVIDVDGSGTATEGDDYGFAYLVTNSGTATLTSLDVADTLGGSVSCPASTLEPGASTTCTLRHLVTQAEVDAGSIESDATASGTDAGGISVSDSDTESVTLDPAPSIMLDKTGTPDLTVVAPSDRPDPGDGIDYAFVVTNTGNVTLSAIAIDDPSIGTVACPPGSLAPGDQHLCTGAYSIDQGDIDVSGVTNNATASGVPPVGDPVAAPDSAFVDLEQVTSVAITKSSPLAEYDTLNQVVGYDIVVTNSGNVELSNVAVADSNADAGSIECTPAAPATLAPGASATCTAEHTVTQTDLDEGSIVNIATAEAEGTPNGVPVSAVSEPVVLTAVQNMDIEVGKTEANEPLGDGRFLVTYTISLTNTGNVTATGVALADSLADAFAPGAWAIQNVSSLHFDVSETFNGASDVDLLGATDTLAPDATGIVLLEVIVDPAGEPGPYLNTATGTLERGQLLATADASASSVFDVSFDLTLDKSSSGHVAPGGSVTWTIDVANTGPSAALGPVTVTDTLDDALTFVSATGTGWSCSHVHGVVTCTRATPLHAGSSASIDIVTTVDAELGDVVANDASVTSADAINESNPSNNRGAASVVVDQLPVTGIDTADVGAIAVASILLGLMLLLITGRKRSRQTP